MSDGDKVAKRHQNYRLVKTHRPHTVEEIADLFGVHKNTVREWVKAGLPVSDDKRPTLIRGTDLADFLKARRLKNKRTCLSGQIYCVRCRAPKYPGGGMAEFRPINEKVGNLIAICPDCNCLMNRHVSRARLSPEFDKIDVCFSQALKRVSNSIQPTVNSDLR